MIALAACAILAGCDGKDSDKSDGGVMNDATGSDEDSGTRDGSRPDSSGTSRGDSGPPPCPRGTEGCDCTSTVNARTNPRVFLRDDCVSEDLRCVAFDLGYDVSAPVQGCVKPCMTDTECGPNRICRDSGFPDSTGVGRICFDAEAPVDGYCHLSRMSTSRLMTGNPRRPVPVISGARMQGCPENITCLNGVFSNVHPDEGICAAVCLGDTQCPSAAPYCNPRVLSRTSTTGMDQDLGVCSLHKNVAGSLCGNVAPNTSGLANRCDSSGSDRLACLRVQGLFPAGAGFCAQTCGTMNPCEGVEPGTGRLHCAITNAMDPIEGGICTSTCSAFPDTCAGEGIGHGRFCYEERLQVASSTVSFCMDRQAPLLRGTVLTPGRGTMVQGDRCDAESSIDFMRCPEPSTCESLCVVGCDPHRAEPDTGCAMMTTTGTICEALPMPNEDLGVCVHP